MTAAGEAVEVRRDSMAPEPALRLGSVLWPEQALAPGDPLPPLWHWAYFPELTPTSALSPDGHPPRHDRWAAEFPRRMAGGGWVRFLAPLLVGEAAERRSELVSERVRPGRQGELVVADWRYTVSQAGQVVIEEQQTLLYRRQPPPAPPPAASAAQAGPPAASAAQAAAPPAASAAPAAPASTDLSWRELDRRVFDAVTLFRFSAATWNAHRIHYDREHVLGEGYPGLVVHGPLQFCLLAGEAQRLLGSLAEVSYRATSPVFVGDVVRLFARRNAEGCELETRSARGVAAALSAARS